MRRFLLGLGLICCISNIWATEDYVPVVREGAEWGHKAIPKSWTGDGSTFFYRERLAGDCIVDGKTYKKCYRYSGSEFNADNAMVVALMREEDKKVYIRKTDNSFVIGDSELDISLIGEDEVLAYDFNLFIGDTFKPIDGMTYQLQSTDWVEVDGKQRLLQVFDHDLKILEGIGVVDGYDFDFGLPYQDQVSGALYWIKAITYERIIGGEIVYKTSFFDETDPSIVGTGREAVIAASGLNVRTFGIEGEAVIEGDGIGYVVYSADGRKVAEGIANGRTEVPLPKGIYIVKAGTVTRRIAVR